MLCATFHNLCCYFPGKAVGKSDPIVYSETAITPWAAANMTSFALVNILPHYFTFPPFPEERGYANEVQRARIGARCQWPKLMLINTEENSEDVDEVGLAPYQALSGLALYHHVILQSQNNN